MEIRGFGTWHYWEKIVSLYSLYVLLVIMRSQERITEHTLLKISMYINQIIFFLNSNNRPSL